jgi:hypothetical protein
MDEWKDLLEDLVGILIIFICIAVIVSGFLGLFWIIN